MFSMPPISRRPICSMLAGAGLYTIATSGVVAAPDPASSLREERGIEVVGVRRTAAGYMLDFRYRVVDAQRARDWLDGRIDLRMIHEASGAQLVVPAPPKIGPLRQARSDKLTAGREYFMFFANPGRLVKADDTVTVVMGDVRIPGVPVQ